MLFIKNPIRGNFHTLHCHVLCNIYINIVVKTREFSENKVLNIVKLRAKTVKVTLISARCDTDSHTPMTTMTVGFVFISSDVGAIEIGGHT